MREEDYPAIPIDSEFCITEDWCPFLEQKIKYEEGLESFYYCRFFNLQVTRLGRPVYDYPQSGSDPIIRADVCKSKNPKIIFTCDNNALSGDVGDAA